MLDTLFSCRAPQQCNVSRPAEATVMRLRGWTVATSWTVVVLWSLVSLGVAICSLTALALPTWFIRMDLEDTSFGVWWWQSSDRRVTNQVVNLAPNYGMEENNGSIDATMLEELEDSEMIEFENPVEILTEHRGYLRSRWSISGGASVWLLVGVLYGGSAVVLIVTGLGGPLLLPLLQGGERCSAMRLISNLQAVSGQ